MKKIAFFLGSDTLVYLCKPILSRLFNQAQIFVLFPRFTDEKAKEAFNILFPDNARNISTLTEAFASNLDYLVCANDWGAEIKLIISYARRKGVTTIGIQESVIDLSLESDRYQYTDVVFAQGMVSRELMRANYVEVTGNPRYEEIEFKDKINDYALINCNFTYGVFEAVRDTWIRDVVKALDDAGVDFKISKHPRDFSNLSGLESKILESGAGVVHKQVSNAGFVITRFSSLIHESILMGRNVIYYNPHREDMGYDFRADGTVLRIANSPKELYDAVYEIKNSNPPKKVFKEYITSHLEHTYSSEYPSRVIADKLLNTSYSERSKHIQKKISIFPELIILMKLLVYKVLK